MLGIASSNDNLDQAVLGFQPLQTAFYVGAKALCSHSKHLTNFVIHHPGLSVVLIYISPLAKDAEHFFFILCISFEKCLFCLFLIY